MSLSKQLKHFIEQNRLLQKGQHIVLAVSGGIDSMVMLWLFLDLQHEWNLQLSVAHINHQLRGIEADEDESFVQSISKLHNVPFYVSRIDVTKLAQQSQQSIQQIARKARYEALETIRKNISADLIATAHQANDNAETVLMNILRGTGIHGLSGIPIVNTSLHTIRPLLFATRTVLLNYAKEHAVPYREDSSNLSIKYNRNYIRKIIIPSLEQLYKKDFIQYFSQLSKIARSFSASLDHYLETIVPAIAFPFINGYKLLIRELEQYPHFIQNEIFHYLLKKINVEITEQQIDKLQHLKNLTVGKKVVLTQSSYALRDRSYLYILHTLPVFNNTKIEVGKAYHFQAFSFSSEILTPPADIRFNNKNIAYVDKAKICNSLTLRIWKPGDRFIPYGMKQTKKVSDYFTDIKLSEVEKSLTPLVECNGKIVWICGYRIDDRFKITPSTKEIIKFNFQPLWTNNEQTNYC